MGLLARTPEWTTPTLVDVAVDKLRVDWAFGVLRLSDLPEYQAWKGMLYRCHDPTSKAYPSYGGRGISVCKRWQLGFWDFISDMGVRPSPELSLDRIENDEGYSPANCRWVSAAEQNINRRPFKARGQNHRGATLRKEQVLQIKKLLHVSDTTVNRITLGRRRPHIEE
jgi:hypothetical protein